MLCFLTLKEHYFKQNILFTVKRFTVFLQRPRRSWFPTVRAAVAHSRVKERPNNKKTKHHCLVLLAQVNGPVPAHTWRLRGQSRVWHCNLSEFIACCPHLLPFPCLFLTKFTPLPLPQRSVLPICTWSCSSTRVPREIWGRVRSSRGGHPAPTAPALPSRDPCRRNGGKTHRRTRQDCYRCHTDATDIPTFLRMGGERERKLELVHFWHSTGL